MSMSQNDTSSPKLLDAKTYVKDLTKHVARAQKRVNLTSLILTDNAYTHDLIEAMIDAAKREVVVTVSIDTFAFNQLGGYVPFINRLSTRSRAMTAMVNHLKAAGVSFAWLGRNLKHNPFGGVTHLKWAVVDDITFCFGGVNLYEGGIESADYMLKFTQASLADTIAQQHEAIINSQRTHIPYPGFTGEDTNGTIYIDSGKKYESVIYDRLSELAKQATHVLVVTQYCPSGALVTHLKDKSDVYYNQPAKTPYPDRLLIQYGAWRTGLRSQYTRAQYLHAKFMIFTMPSGEKIAMTGSHNFSYSGVMFGTREVALETSDSGIIKQLEEFHKTHIA
jgi:cardiolipin synthase